MVAYLPEDWDPKVGLPVGGGLILVFVGIALVLSQPTGLYDVFSFFPESDEELIFSVSCYVLFGVVSAVAVISQNGSETMHPQILKDVVLGYCLLIGIIGTVAILWSIMNPIINSVIYSKNTIYTIVSVIIVVLSPIGLFTFAVFGIHAAVISIGILASYTTGYVSCWKVLEYGQRYSS